MLYLLRKIFKTISIFIVMQLVKVFYTLDLAKSIFPTGQLIGYLKNYHADLLDYNYNILH